jgi:hypothetical protein
MISRFLLAGLLLTLAVSETFAQQTLLLRQPALSENHHAQHPESSHPQEEDPDVNG